MPFSDSSSLPASKRQIRLSNGHKGTTISAEDCCARACLARFDNPSWEVVSRQWALDSKRRRRKAFDTLQGKVESNFELDRPYVVTQRTRFDVRLPSSASGAVTQVPVCMSALEKLTFVDRSVFQNAAKAILAGRNEPCPRKPVVIASSARNDVFSWFLSLCDDFVKDDIGYRLEQESRKECFHDWVALQDLRRARNEPFYDLKLSSFIKLWIEWRDARPKGERLLLSPHDKSCILCAEFDSKRTQDVTGKDVITDEEAHHLASARQGRNTNRVWVQIARAAQDGSVYYTNADPKKVQNVRSLNFAHNSLVLLT